MKRNAFIKHLKSIGCVLVREGANHSLYMNPNKGKKSTVGRHPELSNLMCKIICKQLEIPSI
jgi:mRNA interferase HicA